MPTSVPDLLSLIESQANLYQHRMLYAFLNKDGAISRELTYADVYEQAIAIAAMLQQREPQLGPVALLYSHGPEFIIGFLGAILAGAWPIPLTRPRGQDWSIVFSTIKISGATVVLTLSKTRKLIPEAQLRTSRAQLICTDTPDFFADALFWQRPEVQPNDIAFIQYTSGSTSHPRGVIVTHKNLLHNSEIISQRFGCTPQDIGISWLPFHHDMGLIGHIIQPLYTGMSNYFVSPVDFLGNPLRWLNAISRFKGTISGAPNFGYALCAGSEEPFRASEEPLDLSTWRLAYCGSERIVPAVLQKFARKYNSAAFNEEAFFPCYGMAESTLFVCGQYGVTLSDDKQYPSVGNITDEYSIVIVDPTRCVCLPNGETGEIWLKSPSVSRGYFNDPESTQEVFHQQLHDTTGYLRTGDFGFIKNGKLHFVGRTKNVIKRRGRSYHAEDVEERVEHLLRDRGVWRCAAFEVPGEEEEMLVLLLEHDGKSNTAFLPALAKDVSMLVCDVFGIMPDDVQALPRRSLALTTSGKLQRVICREQYLQRKKINVRDSELSQANKELLHESE